MIRQNLWPLIALVLTVIFGSSSFVSSWLGLEPSKVIALSIMALAAFLWVTEWVPLFVVSFLILLLNLLWLKPSLVEAGVHVSDKVFYAPFSSPIIMLFLGSFVLSTMIRKSRIDHLIAEKILKRAGGSPAKLLLSIIVLCAFFSMWISNTATTAMMLSLCLPIVHSIPKGNPFAKAIVLSIPFSCNIGGLGTPIGTPPNAVAKLALQNIGVEISFLYWMLLFIPVVLVLLFVLWKLLMKTFPPGDIRLATPQQTVKKLQKNQWFVLAIFMVTVFLWLSTSYHGIKSSVIALFPLLVAFSTKSLEIDDFRNLPWDILFMIGGGLLLGTMLQQSGLDKEFIKFIPSDTRFQVLFVTVCLLAGLMTTFMSNTATANLLIPIIIALVQISRERVILTLAVAFMCSVAMALPISTPPNAIAFSSGILRTKDMMRSGSIIMLISFVFIIIFSKFIWSSML